MFGISTRKLVCELIGTTGLTMAAILTSGTEDEPFAIAGFLMCLHFAFGPISGAHVNPAVSLGVFGFGLSEKNANPLDFPLYTLCQFIGNIAYMHSAFCFAQSNVIGKFVISMRRDSRRIYFRWSRWKSRPFDREFSTN